MKNICFCFQMHSPYRLKRYRFFEIGHDHYYYDDLATEEHVNWLVQTSYLPLCQTIRDMINLSKGKFHCSISISGTMIEMFEQFNPEMIDILKELASTKCVEFLATTYSYTLASEYDQDEFKKQLKLQGELLESIFGVKAQTVWNTELLYTDEEAYNLNKMGYKVMMTEGAKHVISWKSPNRVFQSAGSPKMKVLLRNTNLSDELSFHFSDPNWANFPIDAEKYANQLQALPEGEDIINIWVGAETFGIRQNAGTGIFDFLKALPYYAMEREIGFMTPSEAAKKLSAEDVLSSPYPLTWSGEAKDLSIFTGNDLQQEAIHKLFAVAERVHLCQDKALKTNWLRLQDANYLHNMNHIDQGETQYESAYDAFINYMNILSDFLQTVEEQYPTTIENEELNELLKTIRNQEEEIQELQAKLKKKAEKKD
ncbi:MAG: glycoside hydrolase family 57 protein [Paludibacteraceae bacterium]|nr:glycoside hydrolase family 57 protein [Paludibacteraceae bacterium]